MHHLRIALAVTFIEKIKHVFLKLLAILVYAFSRLGEIEIQKCKISMRTHLIRSWKVHLFSDGR